MQKALSGCIKSVTTDAGIKVETLYYLDATERRSWHRSAAIDRAARLPILLGKLRQLETTPLADAAYGSHAERQRV